MLQNFKSRLCGDKDVMVNCMISKRSKGAQKKYKRRHDWVGNVIH